MRASLVAALLIVPGAVHAQGRVPDFSKPVWTSPVEFTMVISLRELGDGRLIVPDAGEREIKLLSPNGQLLGTIGRRGGGPHEFQLPLQAFPLPGDSTLINDREQQRFLLIGPDAQPVNTFAWPTVPNGGDGLQSLMSSDGQGNLYFPRSSFRPDRGVTPLLRWKFGGHQFDSVQALAMQQVVRKKLTIDGQETFVTRVVPFAEGDYWAVAPNGAIAVIRPVEYRLDWRAADGTVTPGAPIPYRAVPVSTEDRSAVFGAQAVDLPIPENKPAVSRLGILVAPNGAIWVSRYRIPGETGSRWDVLDREGKLQSALTLPGRRVIVGFGKTLTYVVFYDEDDVQHLEAYR